jgi:D-alanyl-D-alanine carboxypeptidase/D-alanyl-D-alanine-endopeptidase (penicillin-binding protein 4)
MRHMGSRGHRPAKSGYQVKTTMLTKLRAVSFLITLLAFALVHSAIPSASAQPQRERVVTPAQSTSARPAPSPAPTVVPSATSEDVLESLPQAAPATTSAKTARTIEELRARIAEVLARPELSSAMVGIKVASLDSGQVLFEANADKLLRPASNMKLYTIAAALDRLSPDYRFVTSVYAPARPDADGVVQGDLTIYGRGDPSLAARFNNGDYFKGIDNVATRIVAAGVKRIEGDLVGDESYFTGPRYGSGWEWDDLQWYYGAEVSALTVNDNALDLSVKPGAQPGAPAVVVTGPPDPLLRIVNHVTTAPRGTKRELTVYRGLASDELEVSGAIALDDKGYAGGIGISHPALLFVYLLRASLAQRGVVIVGKTRTTTPALTVAAPAPASLELTTLQSPPLSLIAAQTLKPSQNLYTELILRTLGTVPGLPTTAVKANRTSEAAGLEVVKTFLREAGLNPGSLVLTDASGLSRNDMITATATLQLLTFMQRHRYASVFRDALPIAGVDGTLRNRFRGTAAANNLRAKTGSLSSASSLSGYVTTAAGEKLAFSIMVNNFSPEIEPRTVCIDPIALLLASFTGRSQ